MVIFLPGRIDKGAAIASVTRILSEGLHPGTIKDKAREGMSTMTGYRFVTLAEAVTTVPSSGTSVTSKSVTVKSGIVGGVESPMSISDVFLGGDCTF